MPCARDAPAHRCAPRTRTRRSAQTLQAPPRLQAGAGHERGISGAGRQRLQPAPQPLGFGGALAPLTLLQPRERGGNAMLAKAAPVADGTGARSVEPVGVI